MSDAQSRLLIEWDSENLAFSADLAGMIAANQERVSRGESLAYPGSAFSELANDIRLNNEQRLNTLYRMKA